MSENNNIVIRGLIPNPYFPSAHLLSLDINVTGRFPEDGLEYIKFKQKLEERLNTIDEKYAQSVGRLKGRKIDAAYKTVVIAGAKGKPKAKVRHRILTVIPYPSLFMSKLGDIRSRFYGAGNREGIFEKHGSIVLHKEQHGMRRFITWFLPEDRAAEVSNETQELNHDLANLNKEIASYEQTHTFEELMEYLSRVPTEKWSRQPPLHSRLHEIALNFQPLPLSKQLIDMYVDAQVRSEVKETVTNAVQAVVKSFHERLSNWITTLTEKLAQQEVSKEDSDLLQSNLARIRADAEKYQVQNLVTSQFEICQQLVTAVNADNEEQLRNAAVAAAEAAGVNPEGSIGSTLRNAALKMRHVDEETRTFIENLF